MSLYVNGWRMCPICEENRALGGHPTCGQDACDELDDTTQQPREITTMARRLTGGREMPRKSLMLPGPRPNEIWVDAQGVAYKVGKVASATATLTSPDGVEFPIYTSEMSQERGWRRLAISCVGGQASLRVVDPVPVKVHADIDWG